MSLAQSFLELFRSVTMLTVCLWVTGFILFCIEFFQPMRGVAYALGGALLCAAFATRMVYGSAGIGFMFVFFTVVALYAVHVVSLFTQKREWLRAARLEKATLRSRRYATLVGATGIAITPIDLTGNVNVNDINLVVFSHAPIQKGDKIRIKEITPDKIIVENID